MTSCAGCYRTFKKDYPEVLGEPLPFDDMPFGAIAEILTKEYGKGIQPDVDDIFNNVRDDLWRYTLKADVGMTGANAIAAEEGMIGIMTNEGNAREVSTIPKKYIAVAGIDRIVPDLKDAVSICYDTCKLILGRTPTYISFISGPSWSADLHGITSRGIHGPAEMHVVLLDNGRMKAKEEGLEEILYCINCGICMMFCPIYHYILWKFGDKRLCGPGAVFAAYQAGLHTSVLTGLDYCTV